MKIFLNKNDKMVHLINLNCTEIYNKLSLLNIDKLDLNEEFKGYFINNHIDRLIGIGNLISPCIFVIEKLLI